MQCDRIGGGRQLLAVTVVAIVMVLLTMGMRWLAIRHFDRMTDVPEAQGISAFSYLAMGISSEPQIGPGGYDRSGMTNYETLGPEAERAIGRENLKTYARQYLHGERSLSFFVRKTVCQWCDPWFDSGVMTILLSNSDDTVSEEFREAVQGVWMQRLEQLLTLYVSTCYLAAFAAVIRLLRKRADRGALVLVLYFIGGFVFQLAWETKSRYCYPYFVVLLPLFAYEASVLGDRVAGQVRAFVQSRRGTVG